MGDNISTSNTFFTDQNLPTQVEISMKKEEESEKKSLINAIQLEIDMEKRKIREEMIAYEIIQRRRRELEDEVRKELIMEKQMMGDDYVENIGGIQGIINPDPQKNNVFGHGEEEVMMGEAMPRTGLSGMKRKAETSVAASDEETASAASKDLQKKWYCSLCEVSATSAGGFNLHLHGKKHKAKEALSKCGDIASSISTDSYPAENPLKPVEQAENQVRPMEEEKIQVLPLEQISQVQPMEEEKCQVQPGKQDKTQVTTKKWECSLCQISVTSEIHLRSHFQGKKHKAKEAKLGVGLGMSDSHTEIADAKGEDVKKWYCSLCQVSAASEKNLNDHFQGKKHKAKAGLSLEGEEGLKHKEETSTEPNTKEVSEQENLNMLNIIEEDITNIEAKKQEINYAGSLETEDLEKRSCHSQETRREIVKFWLCKMCNEGTYDEEAMANHRKSSKHRDLLQKIGGGLIVVSSMLKEEVEGEKGSLDAAHEN